MMNNRTDLKGEYKLVVSRNGNIINETDWFDNIILNQGLDRLGSSSQVKIIQYSKIGTGTSTPEATNTQLDSTVATSGSVGTTTVVNSGSPAYETTHTFPFVYAQGAVVGNMTEIGTGWGTANNTLFSRALILDGSGNPTAITLTSIDQLTVYYRLTVIPVLSDSTGIINIGGINYNYTRRICSAGSFMNAVQTFIADNFSGAPLLPYDSLAYGPAAVLSAVNTNPTGTYYGSSSVSAGIYAPGTYSRNDTFNWGTGSGNAPGGVKMFVLRWSVSALAPYQVLLDNPIPKDNTKTMSITARISWGRA